MATDTLRRQISNLGLGAVSAVLAFVAGLGAGAVAAPSAEAQTFSVLYTFTGSSDGGEPYAGLVRDAAGNFYGTAVSGGDFGWGVVFKLDTSGTQTVLHSFDATNKDGRTPYAGLILDQAGNLYGTTYEGGGIGCIDGCGTVFKVDTSGTETVLHSFAGGAFDGCYPYSGLVRDSAGNLYGTTQSCGASNFGTVFEVSESGKFTLLHSFAGGTTDGANPLYARLLVDKGTLYGVAQYGGTSNQGVVYELSKGRALKVLYSFAGGTTDGCNPNGTPTMDTLGDLYGTTVGCGSSNKGAVWTLSQSGIEKVLHSFAGGTKDGDYPVAGVILDARGNLYGDTEFGGGTGCFGGVGCGTVYRLSKTGTLTLLHAFTGSEGAYPFGDLIGDTNGHVYGTAFLGGGPDWGTVWEIAR